MANGGGIGGGRLYKVSAECMVLSGRTMIDEAEIYSRCSSWL